MASGSASRKRAGVAPSEAPRKAGAPAAPARQRTLSLERLIHERTRLGILSALAVSPSLSFGELKSSLGTSDGNLSVHARKLEEAGYLTCAKSFKGRIPKTEFRLTDAGRKALEAYLGHMESLILATRVPSGGG